MKKKSVRILSFIPCILFLGLIFDFSSQNSETSTSLSQKITGLLVSFVDWIFHFGLQAAQIDSSVHSLDHFIRKLAHFGEYFILGWLILIPLLILRIQMKKAMVLTFLATVLFAAGDEFHQSFVSGRSPQVKDVLIDSSGCAFGLLIFFLLFCMGYGIFALLRKKKARA